ncbi:hypothetical protein AMS58_18820 [Pseudoalteromonas porphyrae]|uniref:Uncharacterized protein n=2 Tax=Pseudoalteromonas TaxID=53246 RepID=A0A0N1EEZ5_9GAMM|nr:MULTISPECIES: DUF1488 domain-containing protein [Pseudoalteromonas]KPH56982.1 hypothetical protein ADS77_18790 [Pseudoalteromonas porphyrae]KPH93096.1 hypothetical protein AMS58_18820 [Pseudoalteromonas porphyrae]NMR27187.1 DUF1488 domain-containing protein [Pseudoalteromonas sp. NEC-BIFX-2020_015]NNG45078.1 DUF1488 domain-containing protein [Pseudoalteromonas sp. NEC-BIFX-2020_002]
MNQAIQFIDRFEFNVQSQQLTFFAQVSGLMVKCVIDTQSLALADQQAAKAHFEAVRFDYEDIAEQLIEDEEYNSAGEIVVAVLN